MDILAREQRDQVARALVLTFPGQKPQWRYKNLLLLHSGGTAPDLHRLPHFAMSIQFSRRTLVRRPRTVKAGRGASVDISMARPLREAHAFAQLPESVPARFKLTVYST